MKNKRGVTLVALIITVITIAIIVGITVTSSSDVLQKSKMTDYIGYMKLVKVRADVVLEDKIFNGETLDFVNSFEETSVTNIIADKSYYINNIKTIKWEQDDIASQGIDKSILGEQEYFVVVYDTQNMETIDVLYSTGCGLDGQRYYSLNDMETVVSGGTPIVATTRPIVNLIEDGGIENRNWGGNWTTSNYSIDTIITHSGDNSLLLYGGGDGNETYVGYNKDIEVKKNHKYYISFYSYLQGNVTGNLIQIFWNLNSEHYRDIGFSINEKETWIKNSMIFTSDIDDENKLRFDFNNGDSNNSIRYDDILVVDLTETFGVGKEPDKAWCDANLEYGVTEVAIPTN